MNTVRSKAFIQYTADSKERKVANGISAIILKSKHRIEHANVDRAIR